MPHDHEETIEMVDWVALRKREAEHGDSYRKPSRCMDATAAIVKTASRARAVGTELGANHMKMEALEVLLADVSTEVVSVQGGPTREAEDGQDWDDYTLVEVALFLQPAW
jgi:hypothetical protein